MVIKEFITYEEYGNLLNELVQKIKDGLDLSKITMIYSFMRGGLPIAVHLSHFLEIPVHTDECDIYFPGIPYNSVLVVDDIADTGKTLEGKRILFPTATLFYKKRSTVKPTFYIRETENWIVFPWERYDEKMNR